MTNNEAISCLIGIREDLMYFNRCFVIGEKARASSIEALEMAIASLAGGPLKVEVTEIHTFAKPDDVSDIKFGDD